MATKTWAGGSGSWNKAKNWQPQRVPKSGDGVLINLDAGADTISGGGLVGSVSVEGAARYGVTGDLTITGAITTGTFTDAAGNLTIAPRAELLVTGTADAYGDAVTIRGTLDDAAYNGVQLDPGEFVTVAGSGAIWKTSGDIVGTTVTVTNGGRVDAASISLQPELGPGAIVNANIVGLDSEPLLAFADSSGDGPSVINGNVQGVTRYIVEAGATLEINGSASASQALSPALSGGGVLAVNGTFTVDDTSVQDSTLDLNGPIADQASSIELEGSSVLTLGPEATAEGGPVQVNVGGLYAGGSDTIFAAGAPVLASLPSATDLLLVNGIAASTLIGGLGSATAFGGSGGGLLFGGAAGNNLIVAGTGAATLGGGGNGDQLWANGSANDMLVGAGGNETLGAVGSAGSDSVFGGSGGDVMVLGSGADLAQMGTGNATVFAGSGPDVFAANDSYAGGSDLIIGFKNGIDHIALRGYASAPEIAVRGGNTTITLSDNTHITLVGVTSLGPNAFV